MEENKNQFKSVKNASTYNDYYSEPKTKSGFGRSVLIPLVSGFVGCGLMIGICFGIPELKERVIGISSTVIQTSNPTTSDHIENNGNIEQISLSKYSDTSVYAANKILPSIVGIQVEYSVENQMLSIFGRSEDSTQTASGSGIIISQDGYILTNNHVVASSAETSYYQISEAKKVTVKLYNDDTEYTAEIVGKDEQTDLAVIKIDKTDLTAAELANSDTIKVGEFAMAVGSPLGMESSITCGVISAVNREITDSDGKTFKLIQTDAAINSGNSGGALVNSEGKVIGVNTMKVSSTGVEGMGFAIPINSTIEVKDQLIQYNKVKRPYIGISGIDLDEKTAKANNLVVGVYVKAVEDFSAAEKAELKVGDVIIQADGQEIKTMDRLNEIKNSHQIGEEIKLKINRNGEEKDITVILAEQP